jgi:hypothetical protein
MKFKRFTKPCFLKEIGRELLGRFFDQFKDDLAARKIELPSASLNDDDYYKGISQVAMSPEGLPDELFEAVYIIEEMATEEGQERLEKAVAQGQLALKCDENLSRGDMAMQAYLTAPEVLAQKRNELRLARLSSFEYFGSKKEASLRAAPALAFSARTSSEQEAELPPPSFTPPSDAALQLITSDLDAWFKENNRGEQTTCIEPYPLDGEFWFLLRHGDTYARMAKLEKGKLKLLHFRPAKDDVVVYDPTRDEIRVHAGTKREKELYQKTFGIRLFGDDEHFSERKAFTLEPLRLDGASALEWDGDGEIDRIVLVEFEVAWGGGFNKVVIFKADNLFAEAEVRGKKAIPDGGQLVSAAFDVYFDGEKKPRKVRVRPPNILRLGRYCDAAIVQRWLSEKGFRETVRAENAWGLPRPLAVLPDPPFIQAVLPILTPQSLVGSGN